MSGAFLYLAIVVMWLCVLIPMWLRRDKTNLAELAELEEHYTGEHQLPDLSRTSPAEPEGMQEDEAAPFEYERVDPRQFRARRRAIIVARRRRLLFFTGLLVLATVVTAAVRVIPWWAVAPACGIMLGYLVFLRIAVQVDRERRQRAVQARERARRVRAQRRVAELAAQQEAEIIDFAARQADVLFDQYAEPPRRAVGDG
ncbi:divisome protein SepX/GlpR [Nonomuraea sp. LPB2021202275-12-8]|uniref:divisome protein SepX/GlpR n=1 Tax=Nonomuraea sp. LPB2021202275-12-8 TaxID=3120159 RepID=UPI00300D603D